MQAGFFSNRLALCDLLDQVDSPAWAIQFIAQYLVGWASSSAKTTMHTFSQNARSFIAVVGINELGSELGLHVNEWVKEGDRLQKLRMDQMPYAIGFEQQSVPRYGLDRSAG